MDNLQQEYTSLERELVNLQNDFEKQKVLFNRALRILFSVLETDLPASLTEMSWAEPANVADARHILTQLERSYRVYTLDRERLSDSILSTLKRYLLARQSLACDGGDSLASQLIGALEESDDLFAALAANLDRILQLLQVDANEQMQGDGVPASSEVASPPVELILAIKRIANLVPLQPEDHDLVVELTDAMSEDCQPDDLIQRLHSIVELLEQRKGAQVDQLSEFLKSMVAKLAELNKSLQESQEESKSLNEGETEEADKLTRGIEEMRSGIEGAEDLNDLKALIANQLEGLSQGFTEFKQRREARIEFIEKQYAQLQQRLVSVERDAVSAHTQVDLEHKLALTDHLTGLPNRRAYEEQLRAELSRLERHQIPFAVLVVDIDHFKQINDKMGHLIGDRALKLVAKVLRKVLRASDFLARYGGEEFVVLLAESEAQGAMKTAEKLRRAVELAPFKYEGELVPIRVSVGVTQARSSDTSARLFHRADQALYRAKEGGRNQVASE